MNTTFAKGPGIYPGIYSDIFDKDALRCIFRGLFARKNPFGAHLLAAFGHFLRAFCAPRRAKSSKDRTAENKGNIKEISLFSIFRDFLRRTPRSRVLRRTRERGSAKGAKSPNRCAQPAFGKETTPCIHRASSAGSSARATTAAQPSAPGTTLMTASRASAGSIRRRLVAFAAKGLTWNTTTASGPWSCRATGAGRSNLRRQRQARAPHQRATFAQVATSPSGPSKDATSPTAATVARHVKRGKVGKARPGSFPANGDADRGGNGLRRSFCLYGIASATQETCEW